MKKGIEFTMASWMMILLAIALVAFMLWLILGSYGVENDINFPMP